MTKWLVMFESAALPHPGPAVWVGLRYIHPIILHTTFKLFPLDFYTKSVILLGTGNLRHYEFQLSYTNRAKANNVTTGQLIAYFYVPNTNLLGCSIWF